MIVADLTFTTHEWERLCTSRPYARRKLGEQGAKKLAMRVKELQTSADRATLLQGPGRWHDIHHDWPGHPAGTVSGGDRIVVQLQVSENGLPTWQVACVGDCYKH